MSSVREKSVYTSRGKYVNRSKIENETWQPFSVQIQTIETALLLLNSLEDSVLITVFKQLTEFTRKNEANIAEVKNNNLFDILQDKLFFISNENAIIRRFALYLAATILETMNTLQDFDVEKTLHILELCVPFYIEERDDFCIEYLSVMINKCVDDPQVARTIQESEEFIERFFMTIKSSDNPDVIWNSFETLNKSLPVQSSAVLDALLQHPHFPIDRVICDITNELPEIRTAALDIVKFVVGLTTENNPFYDAIRALLMLQQLAKLFCDESTKENDFQVIETLATAMRTEQITQLFFENNLFDKIVECMGADLQSYSPDIKCKVISIFSETAQYQQFLPRLYTAGVTDLFLNCLLENEVSAVSTQVLTGLNRLMKYTPAAKRIVELYGEGVVAKILGLMAGRDVIIKTREQAAELLGNLLTFAFHETAGELLELGVAEVLADTFGQGLNELSIDFILSMLDVVEQLAQNNEYRSYLGEATALIKNIALLLRESFSAAVVVNNIFRCLCTLVDEENVRQTLLQNFISNSVKRALQSLSNLVKSSVTNFIMQTARFPEFIQEYIDAGVLEVLLLNQKHAFCVSTWTPAIDSILSKCPSLKFCIRNHLGFTDNTAGNDFLVSKRKFDDFRVFQRILKEEVSPLYPIFVVNFDRMDDPPELVVEVPVVCLEAHEADGNGWCYCRKPGDKYLPKYLDELNEELDKNGLVANPPKQHNTIDFDNVAKRVKVIANVVARSLNENLKILDLNAPEDCSTHIVKCHLKDLTAMLHCNFIPIGMVRSGCQFERAILFKALADQVGLPCTLQRSVDGRILFNEVAMPLEISQDIHCDNNTMKFMTWRMLRPTHIVDLLYNVGDLYPLQSRQALQYLRLY